VSRTYIPKASRATARPKARKKPSQARTLAKRAAETKNINRPGWYSGPTAKQTLEALCNQAHQTGEPVDLFGDVDNPVLRLMKDLRKAKGPKDFEITVEWAKSEWLAIAHAAALGVAYRLKLARNKFVLLTQHPRIGLNELEKKRADAKAHERDEADVARQEAAIKKLTDIASHFLTISDKLDAKADLIQKRFMEAWRRTNVPGDSARTG
jgi:hypothetical protein